MDFLRLKVTRKEIVATDTVLVYLAEINDLPINYEAGQFLTFIIPVNGRELRRSYSMSTTPGVDTEVAVVIKKIENGEVSRYLIDHLEPGDVITALPPSGRFILQTSAISQRTVFFISAGSGISPVFSLLKKLLFEEKLSRAILVNQNRDEASSTFNDELSKLQDAFPGRFIMIKLLSNPSHVNVYPQRLNNTLFEQILRSQNYKMTDEFFLCGPRSFMLMLQFVLRWMGISEKNIRKEYFVVDTIPRPPFLADLSPKKISLHWKNRDEQFTVRYPENILQAALKHDLHLPYSCRGGRCGTCAVKCHSGSVIMSINEVLTEKDLQQGLVLTCVGYAETDLELEL
ncbi:MAG: ferredoxin--NADP reductase [Chitinophagaceae bacterium]